MTDWKLAKTVKNNETMRFVFSDQGNKYAGFGNIDGNFFETKPTGESKQQFTVDNLQFLIFTRIDLITDCKCSSKFTIQTVGMKH